MPYESVGRDITFALTGDAMISRALMPFREPRYLQLRDLLHSADVRFTNAEILFHNYEDWPTYLSQTYMRCDPRYITDLQWLGINIVACGNNHGIDYGENGVLTNIRNLDAAGLPHAGSGENYAAAVSPVYLDTPKGRVALISATSSGRPNSRAGEQRRDMKGRPGVNLVRWINEWTVDGDAYETLQRIAREFGWSQRMASWWTRAYLDAAAADAVYFGDRNSLGVGSEDPAARFVRGAGFERHTRIHQADLERNLQSVREARRMADWVIYAIHSHEGGRREEEPGEHIQQLAHAVIDAGADIVTGQGPHIDRGIEIYSGKPIIYSLGSFIIQNDTVERLPQESMVVRGLGHENVAADMFDVRRASAPERRDAGTDPHWQSALAEVTFNAGRLSGIRLHPLEFGHGLPRSQAGRPILAGPEASREILQRFQRLCEPFKTEVRIEGDTGFIPVG